MNTISITLNDKQLENLINTHKNNLINNPPQYATHCFVLNNCRITIYKSKKVLFQGKDADIYIAPFSKNNDVKKKSTTAMNETISTKNMSIIKKDYVMGSDEVGTGDYFGPVVVCAVYANEDDKKFLTDLKVDDSKKMVDSYIIEIGPLLMERLQYSLLILNNKKYNEIYKQNNMNAIKAKLHNQCYLHLIRKIKHTPIGIIDQFTPKNLYYKYLSDQEDIYDNLEFETKAESKYIVVAAASVIARYSFLISFDKLNDNFEIDFKKGAGFKVDEVAAKFIKKYGYERLNEVAKVHFKNTDKAMALLQNNK